MKKVYIVEDENNLGLLLKKYLENDNYEVVLFCCGNDAIKHIDDKPDLWLLDIMLPDIDGYDIIKEIKRKDKSVPVIFMSAKNEELDRVLGLELGAEDYISKPFLPREVVIRVNKTLERFNNINSEELFWINGYKINKGERTVFLDGLEIRLTNNEFELLLFFVLNKNTVVNRLQILSNVWGDTLDTNDRVVDDTIRRLRGKMSSLQLETIYGVGYKLIVK